MDQKTILVFDTETTGLPKRYTPYQQSENFSSARIVSIAYQVYIKDKTWKLKNERYFIIKPDNFSIPPIATSIHGITTKDAIKNGQSLNVVLDNLYQDIKEYNDVVLVAHNIKFDKNVLLAEVHRQGHSELENKITSLDTYCTMKKGKDILNYRKYPKLIELYKHYTKNTFRQHNALSDTKACAYCFFKLINS